MPGRLRSQLLKRSLDLQIGMGRLQACHQAHGAVLVAKDKNTLSADNLRNDKPAN